MTLIPLLKINYPKVKDDIDKILKSQGFQNISDLDIKIKRLLQGKIRMKLQDWGVKKSEIKI